MPRRATVLVLVLAVPARPRRAETEAPKGSDFDMVEIGVRPFPAREARGLAGLRWQCCECSGTGWVYAEDLRP